MKAKTLIAKYLKDCKLSQDQLARKCGLDQATVSKHCSGQRTVSALSAKKYHRGTNGGLNAMDLLGI